MDFDDGIDEPVFTLDEITRALREAFKAHCDTEEVEEAYLQGLAETMMNFFGYTTRILDNVLHPEEREIFYTLEDMGLLRTEREETSLHDGREWRINYWVLNVEIIRDVLEGVMRFEKPNEIDPSQLYVTLPEEFWKRMELPQQENISPFGGAGLSPLDKFRREFK